MLPTSYEAYDEMMDERYAYPDPLGGMTNDEYQRTVGGGDYAYRCERCGCMADTSELHNCFDARLENAYIQLTLDITNAYWEFHTIEYPTLSELPF